MKPLENVVILDLTRVLAGPFCTLILRDLGAEVIKVEVPGTGDDSRHFGPFKNDTSLYFISINRDKKSITINLKTEKGKQIIKDLVKNCDVVVENFRPGTMDKLGLGYDVLKEINPRLIYAVSSGFGHTGPDSLKPAYDILVQAAGGMMSITGWPEMPPTRVGMSIGDITPALYTAIGINAALYQRQITGMGQKIDVAMLDCQVAILENALTRYQVEGKSPEPIGNRHPTITPFQAFKGKDDYFVVGVGNDAIWKIFCKALNIAEYINDPRFATNLKRTENLHILIPELEKIFETNTCEYWVTLLDGLGVPCSPINAIDKVMQNQQLISRNMFVEVEDKNVGKFKIAGNPIKMTNIPEEKIKNPAPEIGEHTASILKNYLSFTDEDIEKLKGEGII